MQTPPVSSSWPTHAARIGLAALALGLCLACDPFIGRWAQQNADAIGGDVKRELEFIQQFGAISSLAIIAAAIAALDRPRRRALVPAGLACGASALCVFLLKSLIGRPRPRLLEPWTFIQPWETYLVAGWAAPRHAWQFWDRGMSVLWSMPSAHTASAFALARVLSHLYPKLAPLVLVIAAVVGLARVVLGAHYPSDVVVGGILGWVIAGSVQAAVERRRSAGRGTLAPAS